MGRLGALLRPFWAPGTRRAALFGGRRVSRLRRSWMAHPVRGSADGPGSHDRFRAASRSRAVSRPGSTSRSRAALRMGLLCGVGALVLLAVQAVGRPTAGSAQPPTAPTRLPASAFSPVRLPPALVEALRARPDDGVGSPGGGASPEDRFGEPGFVGSADGFGWSPSATSADAAPVVPDRVPAGLRPPAVVRFRPRDGSRGVDPNAWLSVRFTAPMDRAATERAFTVLVDGDPVRGRTWWAEDDTVLVLDPAAPLPSGAEVRMAVSAAARSRVGLALVAPATAAIRVAAPVVAPGSEPSRTAGSSTSGSTSISGWRWPLLGPITQRFGESLTRYGWHAGIDIDGSTGDPVVAARAGQVTVAGVYDDCGGLEVHIDHGDGFESWYRHLSFVEVAVGARVAAGARIGRVGNTGCSLGSHLHFAIRLNGSWVDPLRYLPPR